MGINRDFHNPHCFFPLKSDEICIVIILKRNFELSAIFLSGETSSGHKMKYA